MIESLSTFYPGNIDDFDFEDNKSQYLQEFDKAARAIGYIYGYDTDESDLSNTEKEDILHDIFDDEGFWDL